MNHKKSMRIFWISLCLLVVSGTVIIAVVQYRSRKEDLEKNGARENKDQALRIESELTEEPEISSSHIQPDEYSGVQGNGTENAQNEPVQPANGNALRYQFELKVKNGYLDVYYYHTETLFFHTGIPYSVLTVQQRQELSDGKYFVDEQELYGYLESCTS